VNNRWEDFLGPYTDELPFLFIVSQVDLVEGGEGAVSDEGLPGLSVDVEKAEGEKCQRCWNYSTTVGTAQDKPEICTRCQGHLSE
jgi:isoleucyl-tRNA synthetase